MKPLMPATNQDLMLGFETSDDAAVYKLNDTQAAILTVDFLTPIADDPYEFGRIAAANALSDVFAMGAKPLCALNILALSVKLGTEVAGEIMRGGSDAVREAGAFLVGGHSIDDNEPKYGLAVFGIVHPEQVVRNAGARPGDKLYLTKPLGTGILSQAHKNGAISEELFQVAIDSMMELNAAGGRAMAAAGAHAATDVTGFALAGHLHEMLAASGVGVSLDWKHMPLFEGAWKLCCERDCARAARNRSQRFAGPSSSRTSSQTKNSTTAWPLSATPRHRADFWLPSHPKTPATSRAPLNERRDGCALASELSSKTRMPYPLLRRANPALEAPEAAAP